MNTFANFAIMDNAGVVHAKFLAWPAIFVGKRPAASEDLAQVLFD
jgi:hypothetical protein